MQMTLIGNVSLLIDTKFLQVKQVDLMLRIKFHQIKMCQLSVTDDA